MHLVHHCCQILYRNKAHSWNPFCFRENSHELLWHFRRTVIINQERLQWELNWYAAAVGFCDGENEWKAHSKRKVDLVNSPFLLAWKLSSLGTYWMSYTKDVFGNNVLSLLILYTAYLNANSTLLFFWSSVNIAPVEQIQNNKHIVE